MTGRTPLVFSLTAARQSLAVTSASPIPYRRTALINKEAATTSESDAGEERESAAGGRGVINKLLGRRDFKNRLQYKCLWGRVRSPPTCPPNTQRNGIPIIRPRNHHTGPRARFPGDSFVGRRRGHQPSAQERIRPATSATAAIRRGDAKGLRPRVARGGSEADVRRERARACEREKERERETRQKVGVVAIHCEYACIHERANALAAQVSHRGIQRQRAFKCADGTSEDVSFVRALSLTRVLLCSYRYKYNGETASGK
jgi:hypothetical protein